jgi:hypothetical protein
MRRWFQFGVLDLLIPTIVAVGALLWRPAQPRTSKAAPWLFGTWDCQPGSQTRLCMTLYPDGCYERHFSGQGLQFRWTLAPHAAVKGAFVLTCGNERLVVRSESGSGPFEVLDLDGSVKLRLEQLSRWESSFRDGAPDGMWKINIVHPNFHSLISSVTYQRSELVECRHCSGRRDLAFLDEVCRARGLQASTGHDSNESATERYHRN